MKTDINLRNYSFLFGPSRCENILKKDLKNKYFFDIYSDLINQIKGEFSWGW